MGGRPLSEVNNAGDCFLEDLGTAGLLRSVFQVWLLGDH